jgi:hypothetical protein
MPLNFFQQLKMMIALVLCGLVARVPGYRSRGLGSIPVATRFSEKTELTKNDMQAVLYITKDFDLVCLFKFSIAVIRCRLITYFLIRFGG